MKAKQQFSFFVKSAFLFACFIFCSCGIGGGGGGIAISSVSSPSTDDPAYNLFRFTTSDSINYNANPSCYKGTSIFYRIYTDTSVLAADSSEIIAATNSSVASGKAMLDAKGFQFLNDANPVIGASSSDRNVSIRLFNETSFSASISPDGGVPTRVAGLGNFQFSSSKYPVNSDIDFSGTETTTGPWYVAAFAAAVFQDGSNISYSSLSYLDYVRIYF